MTMHPLTTALLTALFLPALAHAVEAPATEATTMEQVVVTAAGFETKLTEAPASISVISREDLEKRPHASLADALRDIEGVDVAMESTDKNGMPTISLRGMPSEYTLVLIDGRRQSNVGNIYPNNFGGGQFGFMPPLSAIDRIEVVRGPMSTLYGSDAIGGVVNIITRKVGDRWHGALTHGRTYQQEDEFGDSHRTDVYAAGPLLPGLLGMTVRASRYKNDESNPEWAPLTLPDGSQWERALGFGGGGKQVASTQWNAGLRLALTPNADHDLLLDFDTSRQNYDNSNSQTGTLDGVASLWRSGVATIPNPAFDPSRPAGPDNPASITRRVVQPRVGYTAEQRYEREQLALTHNGRWSFGTTETSLTHSRSTNLGRSLPLTIEERADLQSLWNDVCARRGENPWCNNPGLTTLTSDERARLEQFLPRPLRTMELGGYVFDTKLELPLGAHIATIGGQYIDIDMEDGVFGMDGAGFRDGAAQKHKQWALFAEDAWNFADRWTATLGLRHDNHNRFGSHFSPRAYLVWNASDLWTFKGGISTGYKAPRPDQLFPGVTGFGGQGVIPLVGTPDLQPETSTNAEIAAYFQGNGVEFNATLFASRFKDKIATLDSAPNCEVAASGTRCVDVGPGWAELGYTSFSQAINIDKAQSRGVELAGSIELPRGFSLRGNYTFTDSEQKSGTEKGHPIGGHPARHMTNATLSWQATEDLDLSLIGEARSPRFRALDAATQTRDYYKAYSLFHLGASWKPSRWKWLSVNARVNNLLDKDFISQSCTLADNRTEFSCLDDYLIKDRRRNVWFSTSIAF